jgi:hypothetical protein
MHPTTPTDPSTPTLHGLTPTQLDAIRGYSDTAASIAAMLPDAAALGADSSVFEMGRVRRSLDNIRAAADEERVGPYADGVRFALAVGYIADQFDAIEAHLDRARRLRSAAMGQGVAK